MAALIKANPRQVAESSAQALFEAAAYPEAIAAAAAACVAPQRAAWPEKPVRCVAGTRTLLW
jgi:hypothetical protein